MNRQQEPQRRQVQLEEQRAADKLELDLEIADLQWLMANAAGRRIAFRWLHRCGLIDVEDLFNPNAMTLAYQAAKRDVGRRTDVLIRRHFVDEWKQMLVEHERT